MIVQCDKEMSIIDVCRKLARVREGEKSVTICAEDKSSEHRFCRSSALSRPRSRTMLSDKSKRTPPYSFQQHLLPSHSQFVTLESCSQDLQCDLTVELLCSICSVLRMFGESVFVMFSDHEVGAAKLTNRWISGCWWGRDGSSDMNTWWVPSLVC